ncbi:band_7_flotillin-like domain protein [Syntrophotalea carbinolica DSM 2380]|uniref:Band_7_flotillin-like domain protein n=1 Tax=Syntrophotalea carbinolica (strain DSM 2380 / NBRC 103641 / GraBd1) TaxID=338963 RepID=Q3A887_SYNC1|nr:flotillin family protein [Syntrophotalea carbinolica]ABA87405.1 band_7_flotillin-like domain protein [Syntrophotalea carbinolica DSM 2380]
MVFDFWLLPVVAFLFLVVSTIIFLASRYKRCPSDNILVIYGKVGAGQSARCIHGGGTMVWPLIQDYAYLSLTPMTINIPLQKALSMQNIRINVPSTFTVGISTESQIMTAAAERLLHLGQHQIEEMAKEIIFGQLRLTVASLTIEQINQDRERFLESIRKNVAPELNKIGLYLINVNITDITDESGYIDSIGKKAAAEAINQAKVDVAEQEKTGAIGEAEAVREKEIRVAENVAGSEKGKKQAEADQRVFVQQQEANARVGEAAADRQKEIGVAENLAEAEKGKKRAQADQRVYVQQQEATAVEGENKSKADIANYNAELAVKQAAAMQLGEVARREAEVEIQKAQAKAEQERLVAAEVVRQEIDKRKVEIAAEAEAEKTRREAKGAADAILLKYQAEAEGVRKVLESKAFGYLELVKGCNGDAKSAATLLMTEKIEQIVQLQVEAIRNIKIDKVTVWDGAGGDKTSTANFLSGLVKSLPPLHDVAAMAGIDLPQYLGNIADPSSQPQPVSDGNISPAK